MPRIVESVYNLIISPTRRIDRIIEAAKRSGRDLYLLSTGQPSIPPPREFREYVAELMKLESMAPYKYTPTEGYYSLREAIAEDLERLGGPKVDPEKELTVTAGGAEGLFTALMATVRRGDEVIIFDPTYFDYEPMVKFLGAKPVYWRATVETGFQPSLDELSDLVSEKTRAIVIVSPDNPTGRIIDEEIARAVVDIAVERDIWILYDEPYKTIIYEGSHVWVSKLDWEHTISMASFSKDPGIPGWRLGYVYGPSDVIHAINLIRTYTSYNPPTIAQLAIEHYLRNRLREKHLPMVLSEYRSRRDAMYRAIEELLPEARTLKPPAGMFMFVEFSPYLRKLRMSGEEFVEALGLEKNVMLIPGSFFGPASRNYIRFSFVTETPGRIRRAIELIREFIDEKA